jgi:hypothetical protein
VLVLTKSLERDLQAGLAMAVRNSNPMLSVWAGRFRLELERRRRPRPPPSTLQLALWILLPDGQLEPWRGRLAPGANVRCDHFACLLPLRTCLERQGAVWPGGNRWKDGKVRAKKAGIHEFCSSGECEQGREYAASVVFEYQTPKFKFYKDDTPAQRRARKTWIRSHTDGEVPTIDTPPGEDRPPPLDLSDPDVSEILGVKG